MRIAVACFIVAWALILGGCTTSPKKPGYSPGPFEEKDSAPDETRDWSTIPDAVPKWEPRARYGNHSPYNVLGKTYSVFPSSVGYRETGIASWYGKKFSGRATSSQEPYDPYAMTAAHKKLPLPTYVRVTNLDNRRQIVVRVNDRGPFHQDRIIDLSYAAAHKLGFANHGTARVLVEAIDVREAGVEIPPTPAVMGTSPGQIYLQVGAFADMNSAVRLQQQLSGLTRTAVGIHSQSENGRADVHRVRVGPFTSEQQAQQMRQQIRQANFGEPLLIRR